MFLEYFFCVRVECAQLRGEKGWRTVSRGWEKERLMKVAASEIGKLTLRRVQREVTRYGRLSRLAILPPWPQLCQFLPLQTFMSISAKVIYQISSLLMSEKEASTWPMLWYNFTSSNSTKY